MPHLLITHTHRPGQVFWEDVWPNDAQPEGYVRIGHSHGKPPKVAGPVPYRMYKGQLREGGVLPDLLPGRWSGDLIVSHRVRTLIETADKVAHHYVPVDLTLPDGAVVSGQFYIFVAGDLTDGIVPQASNVEPKFIGGQFAYYTCPGRPEIAWRAESVAGRRIWVDRNLRGEIFISDDLAEEFAALGLQAYDLYPAPVFVG